MRYLPPSNTCVANRVTTGVGALQQKSTIVFMEVCSGSQVDKEIEPAIVIRSKIRWIEGRNSRIVCSVKWY